MRECPRRLSTNDEKLRHCTIGLSADVFDALQYAAKHLKTPRPALIRAAIVSRLNALDLPVGDDAGDVKLVVRLNRRRSTKKARAKPTRRAKAKTKKKLAPNKRRS